MGFKVLGAISTIKTIFRSPSRILSTRTYRLLLKPNQIIIWIQLHQLRRLSSDLRTIFSSIKHSPVYYTVIEFEQVPERNTAFLENGYHLIDFVSQNNKRISDF